MIYKHETCFLTDNEPKIREEIYADIILKILQIKNEEIKVTKLYDYIKYELENEYKLSIDEFTLRKVIDDLKTNKKIIQVMDKDNNLIFKLSKEYYNKVSKILNTTNKLKEKTLVLKNQVPENYEQLDEDTLLEIISKIINYDSESLYPLINQKWDNFQIQSESSVIYEISKEFGISEDSVKIIQIQLSDLVVNDNEFRQIYSSLVYGHIIGQLISTSWGDNKLEVTYNYLREQLKETTIVLDTNVIISMICHHDVLNKAMISFIEYIKKLNDSSRGNIKFIMSRMSIKELNDLFKKMEPLATKIEILKELNEFEVINRILYKRGIESEKGVKSPLKAFYKEQKYSSWSQYVEKFFDNFNNYSKYYNISKDLISEEDEINLLKQSSDLYNVLKYVPIIAKPKHRLIHDIYLTLYTSSIASNKESITKTVLFSLDNQITYIENNLKYLQKIKRNRYLNLRQLISYLSPLYKIESSNEDSVTNKLYHGYSTFNHNQEDLKILMKNIVMKSKQEKKMEGW